jgi:hypothetical protein
MKWISVKDRLPDKVGKYIIYKNWTKPIINIFRFHAYDIYSKNTDHHRLRFVNGSGFDDEHVTHWMPLPDAPEDGK